MYSVFIRIVQQKPIDFRYTFMISVFDEDRGELRLEKVTTNLNVKQTR
jgi:hypothetical protein